MGGPRTPRPTWPNRIRRHGQESAVVVEPEETAKLALNIQPLPFPKEGVYSVVVDIDGNEAARQQVNIVKLPLMQVVSQLLSPTSHPGPGPSPHSPADGSLGLVVLDHLLVDFIAAVQDAFDRALLERQAVEERFQVDVFLGDVSFETSYSLPGEGQPPRVRVDLAIDWPTWSQTAYRAWTIGETPDEMPEAVLEVSLRVQRLAEPPSTERVRAVLPPASPPIGSDPLVRTATTIEEVHEDPDPDDREPDGGPGDAPSVRWAMEASYEGEVRFDETQLDDPASLAPIADALTRWISSTLVQLADLPLSFHPPDPADAT